MRHTFASALIMDGKPVTQIAHLLGHSSPAIMLKVYAHWFKDMKTDAVSNLACIVCGGTDPQHRERCG